MNKLLLASAAAVFSTLAFSAQAITVNLLATSTQGPGNTADLYAPNFAGNTPTGANWSSDPLVTPPPTNANGIYQSPFNNTGLPNQTYFSVGAMDGAGDGALSPVKLTLANEVDSFTLLWGSIDNYNTIAFLDAADNVIDSFTGADIVSLFGLGGSPANFEQVALLKFEVEGDEDSIKAITFTSTQAAFEFALAPIPEPATLALLGAGLLGIGFASRRRKAA